jgi:hypothetical protein
MKNAEDNAGDTENTAGTMDVDGDTTNASTSTTTSALRLRGVNRGTGKRVTMDVQDNSTPKTPKKIIKGLRPRKFYGRVLIKVKAFDLPKDESPNNKMVALLKEMYGTFLTEDPSTVMLPWSKTSDAKPVANLDKFPTQFKDLRPYADKLIVRKKKDSWFKMLFACDEPVINLTSTQESASHYFFDDNNVASFLATVQDSENTVDLCIFLYSGPFTDPVRLTFVIQAECEKFYKKKLKFGCKARKVKAIQSDNKKFSSWTMADNQPINLEVDKEDAKALKALLYTRFNKVADRKKRPGGYNFRILPAPNQALSGSKGDHQRLEMLRKHQAVIQSLSLIRTADIKNLDKEAMVNGQKYTLRQILMDTPYPLGAESEEDESPMFHSVDYASVYPDKNEGIVHFTAYKDRSESAEQLVAILPAYISRLVGRQITDSWFHAMAMPIINEVTFDEDISGNWLGTWTTEEDNLNMDILTEDMGVEFSLENMELLAASTQVLKRTDDMSEHSFGTHFGRTTAGGQTTPQDRDAVSHSEVEAAASDQEDGGLAN